jgi:pimeloyl-ACP methyl ester carboxylesterase
MAEKRSRFRRWLRRAVIVAAALVVVWLASSLFVAYKLTRRPHPLMAEPPPAVTWAAIESVRLQSSDGLDLGAWYMPGRDEGPSVLVLHGFRGSRKETLPLDEMLVREGCSVLAISMRAHGDSAGDYNDVGYSARHDVAAAVAWLEKRRPGKSIFVQGTSMGAAAAIFAGEELKSRVNGYILECPYRDIRSAVRARTALFLPWPLDYAAYAGLNLVGGIFMPDVDRMSPIDHVAEIPASVPVLVVAGGHDNRALPDDVRAIYERISKHARLLILPDAVHGYFVTQGGEEYRAAVAEFLGLK